MRQLGQLQKSYQQFRALGCEIVAVFREEKDGAEGLKKARGTTHAEFPFLMDLDAEHTGAYSQNGFATYIVGSDGKILAELDGTIMLRPTVKQILAEMPAAAGDGQAASSDAAP